MKTPTGSKWNLDKPVRTSMPISNNGRKGEGMLTGKFETHDLGGELECMVEVSHDYGTDMIFEQFISQ